nr:GIY-YIG nuclease family protein [Lysinibacillus fusiformis]
MIKLRDKKERENRGIENFEGIYIIHNLAKDIYYVGQSKGVFSRAYQHFVTNPSENSARYSHSIEWSLPEIYNDYRLGEKFNISLIPLANTSFSTLDELEYSAISAYNAFVDDGGYNRTNGNLINKGYFQNDDQENAANLILDRIKGKEIFSTLTNDKLRWRYVQSLSSELLLTSNLSFRANLVKRIKSYQKANKECNF